MNAYLIVDLIALIIYIAASFPDITGVPAHEWIGCAAFIVLVVHMLQNIPIMMRRNKKKADHARTGRIILDVLMAIALVATTISGIMVSGTVLPTFGLYATGYYFWDPLHAAAAKVFLALLLIHLVIDFKMAYGFWKQSKNSKDEVTGSVDPKEALDGNNG